MKDFLKKYSYIIIALLGILFLRAYYLNMAFQQGSFSHERSYNNGDASHYLKIGKNIADFHVYSDNNSNVPTEIATWRPPIWPFVLSNLFYFSDHPSTLIILKFLLELSLILFALLKIIKHLSLNAIYILPFLIILIEPQYVKYSITFLSESFAAILMLLLAIFIIALNNNKRYHVTIPVLSALLTLIHPVSVFFILAIFITYLFYNLKSNFKITILHGLLFSIMVLTWPIRNHLTFNKGVYLTASQGATFSKGWNEKVSTEFTNVDGDLANEDMNLKYVDSTLINDVNHSVIKLSKVYTAGTRSFINQISFGKKLKIVFKKLKSNFNPFPEKPKPGILESLSIVFRIVYLIVLIQLILRFFQKKRFSFNSNKDKAYLIVIAVFIGQILMSSYIYTGLRFNAIYSLTMLCCFMIINLKTINSMLDNIYKRLQNR